MKKVLLLYSGLLTLLSGLTFGQSNDFESIFDGKTFSGWEGNFNQFRVENGSIVAGSLNSNIELDEFLCTTEVFDNFELLIDAKITGNQIPGVSFRGQRVQDSTQVGGYQADMGYIPGEIMPVLTDKEDIDTSGPYPLWGSLLDEYRKDTQRYSDPDAPYRLLAVANKNLVENILSPNDWNQVRIIANEKYIEIQLNNVTTVEYMEEAQVAEHGFICLQVHSGTPALVEYKNILLRRL